MLMKCHNSLVMRLIGKLYLTITTYALCTTLLATYAVLVQNLGYIVVYRFSSR